MKRERILADDWYGYPAWRKKLRVCFLKKKTKNKTSCQGSDGTQICGRSGATLHPPENCTSPLRCCYGDVFRLSAPVTPATLAFFQEIFFALKTGQREHLWISFLNLSYLSVGLGWRVDVLTEQHWLSCGESMLNTALAHLFPHVASKLPIPLKNVVCERFARRMGWLLLKLTSLFLPFGAPPCSPPPPATPRPLV